MKKIRNKGITLVALVVTIIILLILAGITIIQLTGNGLFEKTQLSKEEFENSDLKQNKILNEYENKIEEYINGSRDSVTLTSKEYNSIISEINKYPDYENRKNIAFQNKAYTVENDGYIQLFFYYDTPLSGSTVNDSVFINGKITFRNMAPIYWLNTFTSLYLVKKDDIVTYSNTAQKVTGYYYNFR